MSALARISSCGVYGSESGRAAAGIAEHNAHCDLCHGFPIVGTRHKCIGASHIDPLPSQTYISIDVNFPSRLSRFPGIVDDDGMSLLFFSSLPSLISPFSTSPPGT